MSELAQIQKALEESQSVAGAFRRTEKTDRAEWHDLQTVAG